MVDQVLEAISAAKAELATMPPRKCAHYSGTRGGRGGGSGIIVH